MGNELDELHEEIKQAQLEVGGIPCFLEAVLPPIADSIFDTEFVTESRFHP